MYNTQAGFQRHRLLSYHSPLVQALIRLEVTWLRSFVTVLQLTVSKVIGEVTHTALTKLMAYIR